MVVRSGSPLVARYKSPLLACPVQAFGPYAVTVSVPTRSPVTAQGGSIEEREGTDGCTGRPARGGELPRGRGDLRHHAQDGQADSGAAQRRRGGHPPRRDRGHSYDPVAVLVTGRIRRSQGRISAKRLLPTAAAAGYEGSPRNFRRLVAEVKQAWRRGHHRGRRPAVWTLGDVLAID